ncbi:hypothetical protein A2U01_0097483, partial [Trifolium medium]|nr:hypothetical protein [Trifolium medium]
MVKKHDHKLEDILVSHEKRLRYMGLSYEHVNEYREYCSDLKYTQPKEGQNTK